MTSELFFSECFWNILSEIHFINSGFIISEVKNCVPEFWNSFFLSCEIYILGTSFLYGIPRILKSTKSVSVKSNLSILKNIEVQKGKM